MNHLVIAPLLVPLAAGILLVLLRRILSQAGRRAFSLAAVWFQLLIALELGHQVSDGAVLVYHLGAWPPPWGIVLVVDRLTVWMLVLTACLALFALLHAIRDTDQGGRHFHALFQWQLLGLNGAFVTGDLFNLFVFFEILLLASYTLLVHGGGAERVRAGLQFAVINLVGSSLFLFAAGAFYGLLGTLNLADLALKIAHLSPTEIGPVRVAALLLFAVFALKSALAPLHLWLPSAYTAAAAPVAALFAIMTKVGVYALLRIGTLVFGPDAGPLSGLYGDWLLSLGLPTLALGALGALAATRLRQQIAYLVVASVGLLFVAIGPGTHAGMTAGLYYLAHSTLAAAAMFLLSDAVARGRGALADRLVPGPMLARAGSLSTLFIVTALLIAGLPPLSGFIGKFALLRATLATPTWPWILGMVLFSSLLVILALVRSGSLLFLNVHPVHPPGRTESVTRPPMALTDIPWPAFGLVILCLTLTVWAAPILELGRATAEQLLNPGVYIRAVLPGAGP